MRGATCIAVVLVACHAEHVERAAPAPARPVAPAPTVGVEPMPVVSEPAADAGATVAGPEAAQSLSDFFAARLSVPASWKKECAVYDVNVTRSRRIWHVGPRPARSSGNADFDGAVRKMLIDLVDQQTPLPLRLDEDLDPLRGGHELHLVIAPSGDASACAERHHDDVIRRPHRLGT